MKKYTEMSKPEQKKFLREYYVKRQKSFVEAAELVHTYPNKLRRDALALGIKIRGRSAAQSNALKSGRIEHPTKGKTRSEDTKVKISEKKAKSWKKMSKTQRKKISDAAKKQWKEMDPAEKEARRKKATKAVRLAAKHGSKLERHLFDELVKSGYRVDFHKEHMVVNEKLQVDLFLPKIGVAIEVDGPSHFKPIWGHETLKRNKKSDNEKNGLLLSRGFVVIRVKQLESLSAKYKRDITKQVIKIVEQVEANMPPVGSRYFEVEI